MWYIHSRFSIVMTTNTKKVKVRAKYQLIWALYWNGLNINTVSTLCWLRV